MPPTYIDCVLEVNEKHGKGYPMTMSGPAGRQTGTLYLSPASATLRACLMRLKSFATDEEFLRQFGNVLFTLPYSRLDWQRHGTSTSRSSPTATHLRLKLIIQPPEIAALPWELMCDEDGIPLATSTPIVRYFACPDTAKPLTGAAAAARSGLDRQTRATRSPLSSEKEKERIRRRWRRLSGAGWSPDHLGAGNRHRSTERSAPRACTSGTSSVTASSTPAPPTARWPSRTSPATPTCSTPSGCVSCLSRARCAWLSSMPARQGASPSIRCWALPRHWFERAVPAVVAMQFAFPDTSAVEFSSMFYQALADGYPVDACVSEGRKAVITRLGLSQPDWAIPVLYMRSPDGHLFEQDGRRRSHTATQR